MKENRPEVWIAGEELSQRAGEGVEISNNHGYLCMVGYESSGEWLKMSDKLPPRLQNRL
jgi:hypothetical protein